MLFLMDRLGAALLCAFLFRGAPWSDISDSAKKTRLCVAALFVGLVLGLLFYVKWPGVIWFTNDRSTQAWIAFAIVPLILIAFTFVLESLNKRFK